RKPCTTPNTQSASHARVALMNITDRTSRQPRRRSGRLIVRVIIAVLIGWLLLMVRWLVFPTAISSANSIHNVDAVYVLGEATPERLAKSIAVIKTGASDDLVETLIEKKPPYSFGFCLL